MTWADRSIYQWLHRTKSPRMIVARHPHGEPMDENDSAAVAAAKRAALDQVATYTMETRGAMVVHILDRRT